VAPSQLRAAHGSARSPVWVFLARGRFAARAPADERRISLDSLVRIETFQRVTRLEAVIIFPRAFSLALEARERERAVEAMQKRSRIVHGQSLPRFLIFCKRLSSEPFPFGRLNPKAARASLQSGRRLWLGANRGGASVLGFECESPLVKLIYRRLMANRDERRAR
jgi:hypothetical protein